MKTSLITVHKNDNGKYFLRLHLASRLSGIFRFESEHAYSKPEADFRAVMLSSDFGFHRDELPTHPVIEAYPKLGEDID
jgi:hypothetical protein